MNYFLYGLGYNPHPHPDRPLYELKAGVLTGYVFYVSRHTHAHTNTHFNTHKHLSHTHPVTQSSIGFQGPRYHVNLLTFFFFFFF